MTSIAGAGARLDRLPISPFHYRIFWLIAAGMFFDGYDLYVAGPVLGVLAFMIALLAIQIAVVWTWGIEPARRGLESLGPAAPPAS